jgi:hypothetical protein
MGFNSCYLPAIDVLIHFYDEVGLETFIKRYNKYDSYSGSTDSMRFLETKFKEYYNEQNKTNNESN